jgi:predicted GTPase
LQPELETPVPHVLWTVEQVARDLREAFSENVPGAHIFTLGDFWRLTRLTRWYRQFYLLYRVVSAGFNPVSALLREIRAAATDKMVVTSTGDVKQWAVGFCIRRAGFYAIQLYSGQQEWDVADLQAFRSRASIRDMRRTAAPGDAAGGEPLRLLVAGQVKSGKSSVINALFGETRAAVDVLPRTKHIEPYLLERDGMPQAILLDTVGYDAADSFAPLEEEILRCDLVLLVCTALSAARDADRRMLDQLRAFYAGHPDRVVPPVVVVVTHIDQVRPPAEWNPPYDFAHPSGAKARNIVDAVRAVEEDLGLSDRDVIVPVCLRPGAAYNVEDGLAPAILGVLPGARAARYLRCLREYRRATYWRRLWRQTRGAGRTLVQAGKAWLRRGKKNPK